MPKTGVKTTSAERREVSMVVTLEAAREIIAYARAGAAQSGFQPVAVAVLDGGGNVVGC